MPTFYYLLINAENLTGSSDPIWRSNDSIYCGSNDWFNTRMIMHPGKKTMHIHGSNLRGVGSWTPHLNLQNSLFQLKYRPNW